MSLVASLVTPRQKAFSLSLPRIFTVPTTAIAAAALVSLSRIKYCYLDMHGAFGVATLHDSVKPHELDLALHYSSGPC